jgi:hypothetical protein
LTRRQVESANLPNAGTALVRLVFVPALADHGFLACARSDRIDVVLR